MKNHKSFQFAHVHQWCCWFCSNVLSLCALLKSTFLCVKIPVTNTVWSETERCQETLCTINKWREFTVLNRQRTQHQKLKSPMVAPSGMHEDVPLVEFIYSAFTCRPGGVTAGDSRFCSCVPCLLSTVSTKHTDYVQNCPHTLLRCTGTIVQLLQVSQHLPWTLAL